MAERLDDTKQGMGCLNCISHSRIPKSAANDSHVAAQPLAIMKIPRSLIRSTRFQQLFGLALGTYQEKANLEGNLVFFFWQTSFGSQSGGGANFPLPPWICSLGYPW
ncbi:hypothetical protein QR685DRAFT_153350 [Neurospora intermedia]|uniref:Uncharacterized protein n=1 Tax=Neurospora intermedia TaxID=5142 RepID=A0ABR3DJ81_NEUIN